MIKETRFLKRVIKEASKLITDDFVVKAKDNKGDLVTNFDLEIEQFIIGKIKESYPNFDIVSEEFNSKKELTKNCFVIDPIDGTINFANGMPLWGIQVACVKKGKVCSCAIYLPKFKEMYYADKSGAFVNGALIHVEEKGSRNIAVVEGHNRNASRIRVEKSGTKTRALGVACVSYSWIASGKLGAFVFKNNNLWDYLAGEYLVTQAGGYSIDKDNLHIAACSKEFALKLEKLCAYYPDDDINLKHE